MARYRKRSCPVTRAQGLQAAARRCRGQHRHAELKDKDEVTGCKRTADAGGRAEKLLITITKIAIQEAAALRAVLRAPAWGGQPLTRPFFRAVGRLSAGGYR